MQESLCLHFLEDLLLPCDHVLIGFISIEQGTLATGGNFNSDASYNRRIQNVAENYSAD